MTPAEQAREQIDVLIALIGGEIVWFNYNPYATEKYRAKTLRFHSLARDVDIGKYLSIMTATADEYGVTLKCPLYSSNGILILRPNLKLPPPMTRRLKEVWALYGFKPRLSNAKREPQ